jgi:hypothetical protein
VTAGGTSARGAASRSSVIISAWIRPVTTVAAWSSAEALNAATAPDVPACRSRPFASFAFPRGVLRYQRYMARPDSAYRRFGTTRPGLSWLTIVHHWPDVRRSLDAARPTPLGLVAARGLNPVELRRNHVVLAYDYQLTDDNLVIQVYDPNTGPADQVYLALSLAAPHRSTSITHNIDIGHSIRGFFPVPYRPGNPPQTV